MTRRMLIDASHPEEIRVAVVDGKRLEDFDYETERKKQLKGNVYLAKIVRVEPSLQAAFVDYGGNRHGFLAFSEIHPDYYQIPVADREQLLAEESELEDAEDNEDGAQLETVGGDDVEEVERKRLKHYRHYKIQEVVKRRQIVLVQVVKEERGNKGAALTTYLSLAGRYCVLMPNTARGGGISRKINSAKDRKRLKGVLDGFNIPKGMAVIVRTAGAERTKAEIKRDYEYLTRLWDGIRTTTIESIAPTLVHEEANLIKRSIRDLYSKDINEVLVEGESGYRTAKDFMKSMAPSHAKQVVRYDDNDIPLFFRYQVENQIDAIYNPIVQLRSGGYLVIHSTEALVAIDVNSGRATRERHIEETALKTNLEAADEVPRQLRLRDLAGLVVIDFIDMEESRNNSSVERRLKEGLRNERARIQISRISAFGLLEMSRQRLRPSLLETSSEVCAACGGSGHVRSTEATALHVMRGIEEEGMRRRAVEINVFVPSAVGLYILNHKRAALASVETRYGMLVTVSADDSLVPPEFRVERVRAREGAEDDDRTAEAAEAARETEDGERRKRRPRRRRKEKREDESVEASAAETEEKQDETVETAVASEETGETGETRKRRRRGRRGGRRRGKKTVDAVDSGAETAEAGESIEAEPVALAVTEPGADAARVSEPANTGELAETKASAKKPAAPRRRPARSRKTAADSAVKTEAEPAEPAEPAEQTGDRESLEVKTDPEAKKEKPAPKRARRAAPKKSDKPAKRTARSSARGASRTKTETTGDSPPPSDGSEDGAAALSKDISEAPVDIPPAIEPVAAQTAEQTPALAEAGSAKERRGGWWRRPAE